MSRPATWIRRMRGRCSRSLERKRKSAAPPRSSPRTPSRRRRAAIGAIALVRRDWLSFEELARGERERLGAERFLDAQAFVPFRHALGAREAADLELADAPADGEVHDGDVFGLARARGDDRAGARITRGVPAGERLGERTDLVRLEQHGVACALSVLHAVGGSDEEIVADDLNGGYFGKGAHRGRIVLGKGVLDRDDLVALEPPEQHGL